MRPPYFLGHRSMPRKGAGRPGKYYLEHILLRWSYAGASGRQTCRRMMKMSDKANSTAPASGSTRRQAIAGVAMAIGGLALGLPKTAAATEEEISRTAGAIHQEPVFKASRKRVYEALIDTRQFDEVVQLSGAMKDMAPGSKPTEISREVGGAFSLFGGYITGRQIELVPNERVVQAWRVAVGIRESIRLRNLSWRSREAGPRSFSTIPAFLKARRNIWRRDGSRTIGNRLGKCWLESCVRRATSAQRADGRRLDFSRSPRSVFPPTSNL